MHNHFLDLRHSAPSGHQKPMNVIRKIYREHELLKYINTKLHQSLWKSHQPFIKYPESLGTGRPGWHIVQGIKEISQIWGLQLLIREGCTETDSITHPDTVDPGKTNAFGPIMTQARPELPAPPRPQQQTHFNFHSPAPSTSPLLSRRKYQRVEIHFGFSFPRSRSSLSFWASIEQVKRIHFAAWSLRQVMVDGEAELRQLTWVLHLILASETASVNSRRDQVISSREDKLPLGPVQERITLHVLCIHCTVYTHTRTISEASYNASGNQTECTHKARGWGLKGFVTWQRWSRVSSTSCFCITWPLLLLTAFKLPLNALNLLASI